MNYQEQLNTKEWKCKRSELLTSNYTGLKGTHCFMCDESICEFINNEIKTDANIHHKFYIKGRKAWEYPNWAYFIVHQRCHNYYHNHCGVEVFTEKYFLDNIIKIKYEYGTHNCC